VKKDARNSGSSPTKGVDWWERKFSSWSRGIWDQGVLTGGEGISRHPYSKSSSASRTNYKLGKRAESKIH